MAITSRTRLQQVLTAGANQGGVQVRISGRHGPVGIYPLSQEEPHAHLEDALDAMREGAIGGRASYSVSVHDSDGETVVATSIAVESKETAVVPADTERDPVVAHLLRHQDSILSQQTKALAGLLDHYRTALEGARARVSELETTLERLRSTYEEAVSLRYEREALDRERQAQDRRVDRALDAALRVGTLILSQKLGVPLDPSVFSSRKEETKGGGGGEQDPVSAFFSSLTAEQVDKIGSILTPEQIETLGKAVGGGFT